MVADGQIPLEFALCDIPNGATPVTSALLSSQFSISVIYINNHNIK